MNLIRNRLTPMINETIFRALLIRVPFVITGANFLNMGTVFAFIDYAGKVKVDATWHPIPINNPWSVYYE